MILKNTVSPPLAELLQSARGCEASGDYVQAYRLLQECKAQLSTSDSEAMDAAAVNSGLLRLFPLWWAKIQHGGLCLRRCREGDADFYRKCFSDSLFTRQFNRQQPWRGNLNAALEQSGKLPPLKTGLLMWVVESKSQGSIGLASLSSIDTQNLRCELSVGFPGAVPTSLGIKTTLMLLHFALVLMPFNKVYAYIYEDNPQALHNATRLGFLHEGTLKDHFNIPQHGFINVDLIGLTRMQLHGNNYLKTLAKRKIGQDW